MGSETGMVLYKLLIVNVSKLDVCGIPLFVNPVTYNQELCV